MNLVKIVNPKFRESPITIRQLVTHTSSIRDNDAYLHRAWILHDTINLEKNLKIDIGVCRFSPPSTEVSMEDFLINVLTENGKWFIQNTYTDYQPGQIFEYSNMGTTLAALVLEKATTARTNKPSGCRRSMSGEIKSLTHRPESS